MKKIIAKITMALLVSLTFTTAAHAIAVKTFDCNNEIEEYGDESIGLIESRFGECTDGQGNRYSYEICGVGIHIQNTMQDNFRLACFTWTNFNERRSFVFGSIMASAGLGATFSTPAIGLKGGCLIVGGHRGFGAKLTGNKIEIEPIEASEPISSDPIDDEPMPVLMPR